MHKKKRLAFVDFLRGTAIILMALDHASLFWNKRRVADEGLAGFFPHYEGLGQMVTRVITHITPTVFIFIAGFMVFLSSNRRQQYKATQNNISLHLVRRGILLFFIQFTFVNFAFMTKTYMQGNLKAVFFLDVLWAIGCNIIILAFLRRMHVSVLFAGAFLSIFVLPLLNENTFLTRSNNLLNAFSFMLLVPGTMSNLPFFSLYPVFPWTGIMLCGYLFGMFYLKNVERRNFGNIVNFSFYSGAFCLSMFLILRVINGIGNRLYWNRFNLLEFFALSKYPPSLTFLFFTSGICFLLISASIFLAQKKGVVGKVYDFICVFGRVPLFFYTIHLYVYGVLPLFAGLRKPVPLLYVYIIWSAGIVLLYYPCKWFFAFKESSKNLT